jgi:hypothetical protein
LSGVLRLHMGDTYLISLLGTKIKRRFHAAYAIARGDRMHQVKVHGLNRMKTAGTVSPKRATDILGTCERS